MPKKITIQLLAIVFLISNAHGVTLPPDGWRYPNEKDFRGGWEAFRNDYPEPFHVTGDFNADGLKDNAWILIRKGAVGWGLFVFLGSKGGTSDPILLDDQSGDDNPQKMGVSLMSPGKHRTACGKGYWPCEPGEPDILKLQDQSINYFLFEGASSVFYWDKGSGSFKRIWMSD